MHPRPGPNAGGFRRAGYRLLLPGRPPSPGLPGLDLIHVALHGAAAFLQHSLACRRLFRGSRSSRLRPDYARHQPLHYSAPSDPAAAEPGGRRRHVAALRQHRGWIAHGRKRLFLEPSGHCRGLHPERPFPNDRCGASPALGVPARLPALSLPGHVCLRRDLNKPYVAPRSRHGHRSSGGGRKPKDRPRYVARQCPRLSRHLLRGQPGQAAQHIEQSAGAEHNPRHWHPFHVSRGLPLSEGAAAFPGMETGCH